MGSKVCTRCKVERPLYDFSPDGRTKDGLQPHCKVCHREFGKQWRLKNIERARTRNSEYKKEHRSDEVFKKKHSCRAITSKAVKTGKLIRPETCSKCNKKCKPEAHHEDYSKPLEVVWLCRLCHSNTQ